MLGFISPNRDENSEEASSIYLLQKQACMTILSLGVACVHSIGFG